MRRPCLLLSPLLLAALLSGCPPIPQGLVQSHARRSPYTLVEGDPMFRMIPPGSIPPIDRPRWTDVEHAERFMKPEELVLVVEGKEEVRIYSTWLLESHEVVNDRLDGEALLVSW